MSFLLIPPMRIELISFYIMFFKNVYWDYKIIEYLNNIIDNKISKIENVLELNIIYFRDVEFLVLYSREIIKMLLGTKKWSLLIK